MGWSLSYAYIRLGPYRIKKMLQKLSRNKDRQIGTNCMDISDVPQQRNAVKKISDNPDDERLGEPTPNIALKKSEEKICQNC